jgi:hypothetical protein
MPVISKRSVPPLASGQGSHRVISTDEIGIFAPAGEFTHSIGEKFGGGVIFHVWKDDQGIEHGLIAD